MKPEDAKQILEQALWRLLNDDFGAGPGRFGNTIGERPMMFRIAHYMTATAEREGLSVDCDYNRSGDGFKVETFPLPPKEEADPALGNNEKSKRFFPDIVVHQRRTKEHNILVCEIKKDSDGRDREIDRGRLKTLTAQGLEDKFRYQLGAFIVVDQANRRVDVEYFQNGASAAGDTWKAGVPPEPKSA